MISVVAVDENWGIGFQGGLLASIPEDMKHFVSVTKGHTVVMGRKTLESFPGGRPLKNRVNIVLSKNMTPGTTVVDDNTSLVVVPGVEELKEAVAGMPADEVFVIGGGQIYKTLLPLCEKCIVTYIRHKFDQVDTYYPDLEADDAWFIEAESDVYDHEGMEYSFRTYARR